MHCKDTTILGFELWSQPNRKSKAKMFGRKMFVSDSPITWNHPIRDRMRDKTVAFIQILGSNPNRLGGPEVRGSSMLYSHSFQTYRRQDNFSKPLCSRAIDMQSKDPPKFCFEPWSQPNRKSKAKMFGRKMFVSDSPITCYHPIRDRINEKAVPLTQVSGSKPNRLAGPEVRGTCMLYKQPSRTQRSQDFTYQPYFAKIFIFKL